MTPCIFFAIYTMFVCRSDSVQQTENPFVAVTQCDEQNKSLSQWLSATNNIQNKYPIYLWHVTKEFWKRPKTNILLNLNYTTAIKLLWGTFNANIVRKLVGRYKHILSTAFKKIINIYSKSFWKSLKTKPPKMVMWKSITLVLTLLDHLKYLSDFFNLKAVSHNFYYLFWHLNISKKGGTCTKWVWLGCDFVLEY